MSKPPKGLEERRAADGKFGSGRSAVDDDTAADRAAVFAAVDARTLDQEAILERWGASTFDTYIEDVRSNGTEQAVLDALDRGEAWDVSYEVLEMAGHDTRDGITDEQTDFVYSNVEEAVRKRLASAPGVDDTAVALGAMQSDMGEEPDVSIAYDAAALEALAEKSSMEQYLTMTSDDWSDLDADELPDFDGERWWADLNRGDEVRVGPNEEPWLLTGRSGIDPEVGEIVEVSHPTDGTTMVVDVRDLQ